MAGAGIEADHSEGKLTPLDAGSFSYVATAEPCGSNKRETPAECRLRTTIYAATKLERAWIGCDIAILAVKLIREVLTEKYRLVEGVNYEADGIPVSVEQAHELFKRDPFQFLHWLVERIGGFPMQKKVADRGIDGRLYFETKNGLGESSSL